MAGYVYRSKGLKAPAARPWSTRRPEPESRQHALIDDLFQKLARGIESYNPVCIEAKLLLEEARDNSDSPLTTKAALYSACKKTADQKYRSQQQNALRLIASHLNIT